MDYGLVTAVHDDEAGLIRYSNSLVFPTKEVTSPHVEMAIYHTAKYLESVDEQPLDEVVGHLMQANISLNKALMSGEPRGDIRDTQEFLDGMLERHFNPDFQC